MTTKYQLFRTDNEWQVRDGETVVSAHATMREAQQAIGQLYRDELAAQGKRLVSNHKYQRAVAQGRAS